MRKALPILLLVAGCGSSSLDQAQDTVRAALRDPSSAEFRQVRRCSGDRAVVIGEVNARNGFGGYTGFTHFIVADGRAYFLGETDMLEYAEVQSACIRG
jgi:hypothetical protein